MCVCPIKTLVTYIASNCNTHVTLEGIRLDANRRMLSSAVSRWDQFWFSSDPSENTKKTGIKRKIFRFLVYGLLFVDTYQLSMDPYMLEFDEHGRFPAEHAFHLSKLPLVYDTVGFVVQGKTLSALWDITCVCALASAVGLYGKYARVCTALFYSVAYFGTQVDVYQHHYLLCLMLWLLAISDSNWCFRLLTVQIALVYIFSALTKAWDGNTFMSGQYAPDFSMIPWVHHLMDGLASFLAMNVYRLWTMSAVSVFLAEVFLAMALPFASLTCGRIRTSVFVVGMLLHACFQFGGALKIRLFSLYMMSFYVLFLPNVLIPTLKME